MRILHTADWHVGKRLGRYDRTEDHAAVLDEVAWREICGSSRPLVPVPC